MQNLIIGSGRRRTSLIKLFSFPFPRFPLFIFALSPSGLARSWNQLLAVELDLWNSIFFPPPKSCLSVILLCFPPLLSWNIFLRNVSSFTKPGTCGKHSPQSSPPSKQKSSRNLFYFSRNAFHAIFNTTRALDSQEYTNSWKFPCKPNVSVIEKGETGALPHLRDFFGSFFFGSTLVFL